MGIRVNPWPSVVLLRGPLLMTRDSTTPRYQPANPVTGDIPHVPGGVLHQSRAEGFEQHGPEQEVGGHLDERWGPIVAPAQPAMQP